MEEKHMATKRIGMVLQGGGALGAYECGVIKALYKHYPDFHLDAISGVSIGAINAAVLVGAKKDPMSTLEELWRNHFAVLDWPPALREVQPYFSSIWGTPGMSQIQSSYLLPPYTTTSIYDTSPLRRTLANLIDLDRLNNSPTHLSVTAVDIETGEQTTFENGNQREPFSLDMILASGSIAPSFPMTRAKDQRSGRDGWYWDGGFSSNLPLSQVINRLEQCDSDDQEVEREVFVVELFPMRARIPANLIEVQNRLTQLLFSSKLKLDKKLFDKIDSYIDLIQLIDEKLSPEIKQEIMQNDKVSNAYQDLMSHRKIKYTVITSTRQESLTGASNFSKSAIEDRIEAGYQDAFNKLDELSIV
jgi:NTE family protein